jgi:hypothetical protein
MQPDADVVVGSIGMYAVEKSSSQADRALAQPISSASALYRENAADVHAADGMQLVMVVAPLAEVYTPM